LKSPITLNRFLVILGNEKTLLGSVIMSQMNEVITRPNYYQLSRFGFMRDGHVRIISNKEFIQLQCKELQRFLNMRAEGTQLEREISWVNAYSQTFREVWSPFIFPSENCAVVQQKIEAHRWVESEKARMDVGILAELSWVFTYGHIFRGNLPEPISEQAFMQWIRNFA